MKKYLFLLVLLAGCTGEKVESVEQAVKSKKQNVNFYIKGCVALGECLGIKTKLLHFANQPHNPYACHVTNGPGRGVYLYPDAELDSFNSLGFHSYTNAVTICQLAMKNGKFSDKALKQEQKDYEEWEKERELEAKRKIELEKENRRKETIEIEEQL